METLTIKNTDAFGLEILGIKEAKTKEEIIKALENHYSVLEGLTNEALSDIECRISELKYGKQSLTTNRQ